jgi:hypothetical protein
VICDANGLPLAVILTGGDRHDITRLLPPLQAIPPIRSVRGRPPAPPEAGLRRPRLRPRQVPTSVRALGIVPRIDRRGSGHGLGQGTKAESSSAASAWLHAFKRQRTRYRRRADIHQAFVSLACSIICLRALLELK